MFLVRREIAYLQT